MSALAAAERHSHEALELLRHLVVTESPTGDAQGVDAVADQLAEMFAEHSAQVRRETGPWGSHLVMDIPGLPDEVGAEGGGDDGQENAGGGDTGPARVIFVGHSDTVWARGTLETMPCRVADGIGYGPGIFDMKSGLVVMHMGLRVGAELGLPRPPVRIIVVGDEEIGSPTSKDMLLELSRGARAVLGFESPHPDGALKMGRLGSTRLRVEVAGRAAHAALDPESGINAIDELTDQLGRVRQAIARADERFPGDVLCNIGTISGGGKTNVVPAEAWAEIGLRFRSPEVEEAVLGELTELAAVREGAKVSAKVLSQRPAWQAEKKDEQLLEQVEAAADAVGLPVIGGHTAAGAGDANYLGSTGAAGAGLPTLDGFGPRGAGAHAEHEQIIMESLPERVALLAELLTLLRGTG